MHIGINEVILSPRSSGTRQREINVLPTLLDHIQDCGWRCSVYFACDLGDDFIRRLIGRRRAIDVVATPIPSIPTLKRVGRGLTYWPARIRRDRLALFHTSYYPIPPSRAPVVLTVNDLRFVQFPETYPRARRLFLRATVPSALRRAERVIAISEFTKRELIEYFGTPPEKIDVAHIPAGPQFRPIEDRARLEAVRRKLHLPARFILFVGHLEPRKNLGRLLRAYVALRDRRRSDHALVILGKPQFAFEELTAQAACSRYRDDIHFTGYVDDADMPAVYNLADVLAFPSLHEGFGVPVVEAMACGTPVVTSNATALPEVAGGAAVLVDPTSVEEIADGLESALCDPGRRRRMIQQGLQRAGELSPQAVSRAIFDCYRQVLGSR